MNIEAAALSVLFIEQTVESNIKGLSVEQTLSLTDSVSSNLLPQQLSSSLHIIHLATVVRNARLSVSQTLTLTDSAHPRATVLTVEQQLIPWSDITNEELWPTVEQTLVLTQLAEGVQSKHTSSELTLAHEVAVSVTYNHVVEHSVNLLSKGTGYLPKKCWYSYEIEVIAP